MQVRLFVNLDDTGDAKDIGAAMEILAPLVDAASTNDETCELVHKAFWLLNEAVRVERLGQVSVT